MRMRFTKKGVFLLSLLVLLVFLLLSLLLFSKPLSIELKATPHLSKQTSFSKKETQILSYLNKYKSQSLWQINLKQVAQNIEDMSLGMEVYVHRKYPSQLIIWLYEKKTILLFLKGNTHFYSISSDGSLDTQKSAQNIPDVPILRGASFESDQTLRLQVLKLLEAIPKQKQVFSVENISEILYDSKQDSFLIYLSTRPLAIKLNHPPLSQKIKNIEFVLEYLKKEGREQAVIDARFDKKIIVKKKI